MKRICCALLTLVLAALCGMSAFAAPLRFDAGGKYKILMIADPQDDATPEPDMAELIETAVRKTEPDLIVVLGDLVENWAVRSEFDGDGNKRELSYAETLKNCRAAVDAVFAPIIASGVPYTAILGNNDYESGVSAADWYALLRGQKGILLPETKVYSDGRTDSVLPVLGTDGKEALRLFFLDTGTNGVTKEQVNAFGSLNDNREIPAIVFQHIPDPEYALLWRFCLPCEADAFPLGKYFFVKRWSLFESERDRCTLWNGGFTRQFAGWKRCGNVIGAYFGHLHNISAEGVYHGVRMGAVYGDRWNGAYRHGFAMLTFDERDVRDYTWTSYRCTGSIAAGDALIGEEHLESNKYS